MTITAKIIADSISPTGKRITSLQLRYPRFVHAEFMTHRVFSRNASSSRAIPVERLIQDILDDTAMPIHWGRNQPGMQAHEECDSLIEIWPAEENSIREAWVEDRAAAWKLAMEDAVEWARRYAAAGYHKQIVNRLLEPFSHINVLVTATEFDNFFELRNHPDAQPEIMVLAQVMKKAMMESIPTLLEFGQWHLPYIRTKDYRLIQMVSGQTGREWLQIAIEVSVARCARVSYLTHEGKEPGIEADLALYERLVGSVPLHASPCEHQATPLENPEAHSGNFIGWSQYRKMLERGGL